MELMSRRSDDQFIIELGGATCTEAAAVVHQGLRVGRTDSVDLSLSMRLQQRSLRSELLVEGVDSLEIIESYPDESICRAFSCGANGKEPSSMPKSRRIWMTGTSEL
jgi:hypothetical protein